MIGQKVKSPGVCMVLHTQQNTLKSASYSCFGTGKQLPGPRLAPDERKSSSTVVPGHCQLLTPVQGGSLNHCTGQQEQTGKLPVQSSCTDRSSHAEHSTDHLSPSGGFARTLCSMQSVSHILCPAERAARNRCPMQSSCMVTPCPAAPCVLVQSLMTVQGGLAIAAQLRRRPADLGGRVASRLSVYQQFPAPKAVDAAVDAAWTSFAMPAATGSHARNMSVTAHPGQCTCTLPFIASVHASPCPALHKSLPLAPRQP